MSLGAKSGVVVLIVGMAAGLSACHKTFSASVHQPNPLAQPLDTLRHSEELVITTGDMDLVHPRPAPHSSGASALQYMDRYPLRNKASFTIVSRDRLRFHVQIEHKWKQYTDISTWKAVLTDDQGNAYQPTSIDSVKARHLVETWSFERRSTRRNAHGSIVHINNDGYRDRQPLGNLSVFRGKGDFVFFRRDIFGPKVRSMSLSLTRSGITFKFTWKFAEDGEPVPVSVAKLELFR